MVHGMQQGQRRFPFAEIVTGIFTQRLAICAVVEPIVN